MLKNGLIIYIQILQNNKIHNKILLSLAQRGGKYYKNIRKI